MLPITITVLQLRVDLNLLHLFFGFQLGPKRACKRATKTDDDEHVNLGKSNKYV